MFRVRELYGGINFVSLAVGMLGVAEILRNRGRADPHRGGGEGEEPVADKEDLRRMVAPVLRATGLGSALGILPGGGHRRLRLLLGREARVEASAGVRTRGDRGGSRSGVGEQRRRADLVHPLLTLGLPAIPVMALMIGAFIIQGITPGRT